MSNASIRPDRDHYFGRIWRVQHNDAKKLDLPNLDPNNPAGLVAALKHPNEWVRMTGAPIIAIGARQLNGHRAPIGGAGEISESASSDARAWRRVG